MDFESFRQKLLRRLTSPVELVYAVTHHWFLILLLVSIGTLGTFLMVSNEPPLYSCHATLILESPQQLVNKNFGAVQNEGQNFINDQIRILHSDAVLTKLVKELHYDRRDPGEDHRDRANEGDFVNRAYRNISERVSAVLDRLDPARSATELNPTQRAIKSFRLRSKVEPVLRSSQVALSVTSPDQNVLETEMETWILSYKSVLKDITQQTFSTFLDQRIEHWKKLADQAKEQFETFLGQHPDANESMREFVHEQAIRQQFLLENLQAKLDNTDSPEPRPRIVESDLFRATPDDEVLSLLEDRKNQLEVERIELKGRFPESSRLVQDHDAKIRAIEEHIESLENPTVAPDPGNTDADGPLERLQKSIVFATEELTKTLVRRGRIENEMSELRKLREDYDYCLQKQREYERMDDWSEEIAEGRQMIQVNVLDQPMAGPSEVNKHRNFRVLLGLGGGLALGVVIALGLELFSRRIRFKKDIEEDLGLEVVGVLPDN